MGGPMRGRPGGEAEPGHPRSDRGDGEPPVHERSVHGRHRDNRSTGHTFARAIRRRHLNLSPQLPPFA
jgi:hypothetical protein